LKVDAIMKNAVFGDVTPCGYRNASIRSVLPLLVTAKCVPSSPILVSLMLEAIRSSETSVLKIATRRDSPEDNILHSYRRENLKSSVVESMSQNFRTHGKK
jgi:hypothetical protein